MTVPFQRPVIVLSVYAICFLVGVEFVMYRLVPFHSIRLVTAVVSREPAWKLIGASVVVPAAKVTIPVSVPPEMGK